MAPITRSARKHPSTLPEQSWSFPQENRPPRPQFIHEDVEDEEDGQDTHNHDLEMEDGDEDEEEDDVAEEETGDDEDVDEGEEADSPDPAMSSPRLMSSTDVQQAVMPLQNLADRVWKQVEDFAKNLDRFNPSEKGRDDAQNWKDACRLVEKYKAIAQDNLKRAEKDRKLGKTASGSRPQGSRQGSGRSAEDSGAGDDRERCQSEVDTWEILGTLLGMDGPISREAAEHAQAHTLQSLHRYSTDFDIWESFLSSDLFSRESVAILKWLHTTADSSEESVETSIAPLETEAERGDGLWASGWLYTKEEIKKSKRLRAWPQVIKRGEPGVDDTFKNKKGEPLVTQLDPDATSRQACTLYAEDDAHEKAMWLASWELLRRGKSWDYIRQWFQDRGEGWRALSLRGSSIASASELAVEEAAHGLSRMMNPQKLSVWRESCVEISKGHDHTRGLEEAVYGLLCGNFKAAVKACKTLDDQLFVRYNTLILNRHTDYCLAFRDFIQARPDGDVSFAPRPPAYDTIRNFLNHARQDLTMEKDCLNPYKLIQAAILTKDYPTFFARQGQALNKIANESQNSKLFLGAATDLIDMFATNAAEDSDALRVTAHLFLIARALGFADVTDPSYGVMEDNLVGYISFLQQAGKMALIPLYASKLSESRRHRVLGQMLVDVTDPAERSLQTKLMKQYRIDLAAVLRSQFQSNLQDANAIQGTVSYTFHPRRFLEAAPADWGHHVRIQSDFLEGDVPPEDVLLIRSLEWHHYLNGHWVQVCHVAAVLYKRFIALGHFAAARTLCDRAELSKLSSDITGMDLSRFDVSSEDVSEDESEGRPAPRRARSSQSQKTSGSRTRQRGAEAASPANREQLYEQARTWRELERLVIVFDLFAEWGRESQEVQQLRKQGATTEISGELKKGLKALFDKVCLAVQPLLEDWLTHPKDDEEAKVLEDIRVTYLPEVIIAFNSVLNFAGHALTRTHLIHCMDLATEVATNPNLTQVFVASKRMREVTKAFAFSAKAMLAANENAAPKKLPRSKFPNGENMEIWQVKAQDVGHA